MSALAVFANLDLVSVLASFLSVSDLFRAASVTAKLSSLLSADRVWSPLLSAGLAVSTVPEPPSQSPPPSLSAPVPSTAKARRLCKEALLAHLRTGGYGMKPPTHASVLAIRRLPGTLTYHMRSALQLEASAQATTTGEQQLSVLDCRSFELEWSAEKRIWTVVDLGPNGYGKSVLNTLDDTTDGGSSSSDTSRRSGVCEREAVSDAWDDSSSAPTLPTATEQDSGDASKQQYIRTFACSCHPQLRCHRILAPHAPIPVPTQAVDAYAGHFNELWMHVMPYPALDPVPVCRSCRGNVARWVQSNLRPSAPVRCLVRVNAGEWDVCYQQGSERYFVYRRFQLQWTNNRQGLNSGGGWQLVRWYRAHSGAYCQQSPERGLVA